MTSKPSKISKCDKASSKLYQSSLHDFMKPKRSQKENIALSKTPRWRRIQRKEDGIEGTNKKWEDVSQSRKGWQTEVPFVRTMSHTPPQHGSSRCILVPDAPSRRGTPVVDDHHFAIRSPPINVRFRDIEVVPPSQSQDTGELRTRYSDKGIILQSTQTLDTRFPSPNSSQQLETGLVQSSQSQYLISYEQSPILPASHGSCHSNSVEVVQTSQVAEESELELGQSSSHYRGLSKTGINDPQCLANPSELTPDKDLVRVESLSNADEADIPVIPPYGQIVVIPQMRPGLPFRLLPSLVHSPFHPGESLASTLASTSPHIASSQYTFPSEGASYPPEVRSFFRMFEEDRHSLGSEFHGLSQSQASEESRAY